MAQQEVGSFLDSQSVNGGFVFHWENPGKGSICSFSAYILFLCKVLNGVCTCACSGACYSCCWAWEQPPLCLEEHTALHSISTPSHLLGTALKSCMHLFHLRRTLIFLIIKATHPSCREFREFKKVQGKRENGRQREEI